MAGENAVSCPRESTSVVPDPLPPSLPPSFVHLSLTPCFSDTPALPLAPVFFFPSSSTLSFFHSLPLPHFFLSPFLLPFSLGHTKAPGPKVARHSAHFSPSIQIHNRLFQGQGERDDSLQLRSSNFSLVNTVTTLKILRYRVSIGFFFCCCRVPKCIRL